MLLLTRLFSAHLSLSMIKNIIIYIYLTRFCKYLIILSIFMTLATLGTI